MYVSPLNEYTACLAFYIAIALSAWALRMGRAVLRKERGEDNAADLFTKHLSEEKMLRFLDKLGFELRSGRAPEAPELAKGAAQRRVASVALAGGAVAHVDCQQPWVHRWVAPG